MIKEPPIMAPYARHVFICMGHYCDPEGKSKALYRKLAHMLGELGHYDNSVRVKRGVTPCLGVCYNGPILVVYPDGVWYHDVNEERLQRIIDQHLCQNQPVKEYMFHKLDDMEIQIRKNNDE